MRRVAGLVWKQSSRTTCGAAALMVALAERRGTALSRERELEIWRHANGGSSALPGSFPGLLAVYARREGAAVTLSEDRDRLDAVFGLLPAAGHDLATGLEEHWRHLRTAESAGIPVRRGPMPLERVVELAADAVVLMLVSTAADVSGLHWVLVASDPRGCAIMEPALGERISGSLARFVAEYSANRPFLGVAITVA